MADEVPTPPKSRSQKKREADAVLELAAGLVDLPRKRLALVSLPAEVRAAVDAARAISSHGARKREIGYVARLLRAACPEAGEVEAIAEAFASANTGGGSGSPQMRRLELWRDRILAEGDGAIEALLDEKPEADRRHLRQLARRAHKSSPETPASTRAGRELLAYLREMI